MNELLKYAVLVGVGPVMALWVLCAAFFSLFPRLGFYFPAFNKFLTWLE